MRNFVNYVNNSFSGGQNDANKPSELAANEAVLIKNAYIHQPGKLIKRSGIDLVGDDTGNYAINGQFAWTTPAGTKYFLRMVHGVLQYLNSTTWTAMDNGFTADLPTCFVPAAGKLYIFNGTDTTHSWDGAAVTLNSCLTELDNSTVPTAKWGVYYKNYMILFGNCKLNSTTYKSRAYISNLGDPDTFTTATDYFDVNANDGQQDTAIAVIDKFLIFGKEKTIHIVTGDSPDDWILSSSVNNLRLLESSIGIASHWSITQVGNDLWYMGSDGLIRSIVRNEQGTAPLTGIVCGNILGTMAGINKGQLSKVASATFDGRVYFAMPNGSSTYNNLVMVADTRVTLDKPYNPYPWVTYSGWNPAYWTIYTPSSTPQLYYGEASADSLTYQAETGTDDAGGAIDFDYKSSMIDLDQPNMRKTTRFIIASGESGGDYDVDIYSSDDGTTYTPEGSLNLNAGYLWNTGLWDSATWSAGTEVSEKYPIARASTKIQIRFRNNQANQAVTMYPYTLAIKPKKVK